jgi:hypothetical protein
LPRRRFLTSRPNVRSTIQRLGSTLKPLIPFITLGDLMLPLGRLLALPRRIFARVSSTSSGLGLVEAHDAEGEMFGFLRLKALIARHAEEERALGDFLVEELYSYVGEGWEDVILLTLRRHARLAELPRITYGRTSRNAPSAVWRGCRRRDRLRVSQRRLRQRRSPSTSSLLRVRQDSERVLLRASLRSTCQSPSRLPSPSTRIPDREH